MRKLNKKQKELIKNYWKDDMLDNTNVYYMANLCYLKRQCEEINDYETLYSDINRLVNNLQFSDDYVKTIDNFI